MNRTLSGWRGPSNPRSTASPSPGTYAICSIETRRPRSCADDLAELRSLHLDAQGSALLLPAGIGACFS